MKLINVKELEVDQYVKQLEMMLTKDDIFMNSKQIAELTGKEHRRVLEDIRDELDKIEKMGKTYTKDSNGEELFRMAAYTDAQNKVRPLYIINRSGIYQILARYSATVRRLIISRIEVLDAMLNIRDKTDRDPEKVSNLHYNIGPLLYYIYDVYSSLKTDPTITDDMKEHFTEEERRWAGIYKDEDKFLEWWEQLRNHYRDTGVKDRYLQ